MEGTEAIAFPAEALRRRIGFAWGGVLLPDPRRCEVSLIPASAGVAMLWLRGLREGEGPSLSSNSSEARPIDFALATGRRDLKGGAGSVLAEGGGVAFTALAVFCLL